MSSVPPAPLRSWCLVALRFLIVVGPLGTISACRDDPVSTGDLEMVAHGIVSGRVLNATGAGVAGAVVGLGPIASDPASTTYQSNSPITTDVNGSFSLLVQRDRGAPNRPSAPTEVPATITVIATIGGVAARRDEPITLRFGPISATAPVVAVNVTVP